MQLLKICGVLAMLTACLPATAAIIVNVKKDFGAAGDGRTDDTKAFLAAVRQVNRLKTNVTLLIPAGNYLVRPQNPANEATHTIPSVMDVLAFDGCTNITVKGAPGAKIKFAPGMYYGAFRMAEGNKPVRLEQKTMDYQYQVAIGHGIKLTNCSKVSISGIEIDGNNGSLILGNEFGDTGYQINNDGLYVENTTDLTVTNSYFHHFGRDGILLLNKTPQEYHTPDQHIRLSKCRFEYNGRQGFTWAGGVGVSASDCSFSYTGRGKISSAPWAGVDFEPNGGFIAKGGLFTNCSFIDNAGIGVITDAGGPYVRDMKFVDCRVVSGDAAAVWIKGPAFRFVHCDIRGGFLFGCAAANATDGTRFTGCRFSDAGAEKGKYNFLVESNGARYLVFDSCDFRVAQKALVYVSPGGKEEDRPVFNSCSFTINYKSDAVEGKKPGLYCNNTRFTGNTVFRNNAPSQHGWNIASSVVEARQGLGSDVTISKGFALYTYETLNIGGGNARTTLKIDDGGELMIYHNAGLNIARNATLLLKSGGALWIGPGVKLKIEGELIAEDGAAICINDAVAIDKDSYRNIHLQRGLPLGIIAK